MIELTDTNSSRIAAEFVRGRKKAGSPAMGMVMTLVIVVPEDDAEDAMKAAREASPEAYERLILDVLLGDPPLFPRHEEVELSWKILDPVIEHWARKGRPDQYESGTWGPPSADKMLARDGRAWRRP